MSDLDKQFFRNILLLCLFAVIWWWRQQRWYVCAHEREGVEAGSKKTFLEVGPIIHPVGSGVQTQVLQH